MIDKVKEDLFYKGEFSFSYSSLNRLLFSPKLFYRDYILKERETKMDKHLIEGRLIHLLLLEPDRFNEEFVMTPLKMPSDSVKRVLRNVSSKIVDPKNYIKLKDLDDQILKALKEENLYQSFKEDSKRLDKIITEESEEYFKFLQTTGKTIIDADTFARCMDRVVIIRANDDVTKLLMQEATDFEMDTIQVYNEKKLQCDLSDYKFGLKGIVDKYIVDDESKTITIVDLKTTAKPLENFAETVDFYNYWLQAAVYSLLVIKNVDEKQQDYKIIFKFVVIDKYDQVYVFPVSEETLLRWMNELNRALQLANYHYSERKYDLPYDFANGNVTL
mgnify:FL=1|tara:strand:+ start:72 stop:1064 length:993 start_codon:yes stop_codon:yes gene_type:complete